MYTHTHIIMHRYVFFTTWHLISLTLPGDVQESHLGGTFREGADQGPSNVGEAKVSTSQTGSKGAFHMGLSQEQMRFDGFNGNKSSNQMRVLSM